MSNINYESLIDKAMFIIVKNSLETIKDNTLPGNHHFYITFLTNAEGVSVSNKLKVQYPQEMTIVLQHQFTGLEIDNEKFSVTLFFDGIPETLVVPYSALTSFADPSVKFGLQFKHAENQNPKPKKEENPADADNSSDPAFDNVVSLDQRRKSN
ncbi:MAG: ClpXP protease specificity-enhancing factor SspB [Rickettsiales bacterium]